MSTPERMKPAQCTQADMRGVNLFDAPVGAPLPRVSRGTEERRARVAKDGRMELAFVIAGLDPAIHLFKRDGCAGQARA
jgi:hypothetical protein